MPGRLYLKIFLSFIGVIVLAMLMVAMLFRFTEGKKFVDRFQRLAKAQVVMVRTVVETQAATHADPKQALQELVNKLGEAYLAKMWITDESGALLVQSFPGPLPTLSEIAPDDEEDDEDYHGWRDIEGFEFTKCGDSPHCIYVTIPFGGTGNVAPGIIHYFYRDPTVTRHEEFFLVGLLGICLSVALLIMPVSWFITRRLNRLRTVALRIADGDLTHRADICGKDEVANVGRALNHMADSLARMIRGSKELTANVSHELRTPLTRIRIAEEMLRERFGEDGAAHLDSIREDVDALDSLIGRLLELSKLDLKDAPFTMEPVDITELVSGIIGQISPIAEHHGLVMTTNLPGKTLAQANGEALVTAFGNILENGAKHADKGGWLAIDMYADESTVTVIAENAHSPLPADELTAIFEPFRRARGTIPDGSGLGLAIAAKIIERHNGRVWAENRDGGVRFTVEIPR